MKKIKEFTIVVAVIFTVTSACSSGEKEIRLNTAGFLEAYFRIDYLKAGSFCTAGLAEELENSLKNIDSLEGSVKEMLHKHSREVKTEIVSVNRAKSRDSASVIYKIILPNFPQGIENTLSFAKVNKEWKIISLGN